MKNELKKFLTLGAALAGSALMVSCDGSDGQNGTNGTNGIDGNSPNLAVAAPTNTQLAISKFNFTVDSGVTGLAAGTQFQVEFDSTVFGKLDTVAPLPVHNSDQVTFSDYSRPSATQLSFDMDLVNAPLNFELDDMLVTVLDSDQKTLIGTWTGGVSTTTFNATEIVVDNSNNGNLFEVQDAANANTPFPSNQYQGYVIAGGLTPVFRDVASPGSVGISLPTGAEAILVRADLVVGSTGTATQSYVFVRTNTFSNPVAVSGTDFNVANTFAGTLDGTWRALAIQSMTQNASGTVIIDLQSSTGNTGVSLDTNRP